MIMQRDYILNHCSEKECSDIFAKRVFDDLNAKEFLEDYHELVLSNLIKLNLKEFNYPCFFHILLADGLISYDLYKSLVLAIKGSSVSMLHDAAIAEYLRCQAVGLSDFGVKKRVEGLTK